MVRRRRKTRGERRASGKGPFRKRKSTTIRRAGGLPFRTKVEKAKARQCFKRCTCKRVQSTRFVWQEIIVVFDVL